MSGSRGAGRVWLDVPFDDKDAAKRLGARWDPSERRWYAGPGSQPELLARWPVLPDVPDVLTGEDRSFGAGLKVDMIPSTVWFTNVRSAVSKEDWERLRRMLIRRAGGRCELCGAGEDRGVQRWLEAHERFAYDDTTGAQVLRRLLVACTPCHEVTHFGLAQVRGRAAVAFAHLRSVTGMSEAQAGTHVEEAFAAWRARSARAWSLDLSMLTGAGIAVEAPAGAVERAGQAVEQLAEHRSQEDPGGAASPEPRSGGRLGDAGPAGPGGLPFVAWFDGPGSTTGVGAVAGPAGHGVGRGCGADPEPGVSIRAVSAEEVATGQDPMARWLRGEPGAAAPDAIRTPGGGWQTPQPAPPSSPASAPPAGSGSAQGSRARRRWWRRER